MDSETIKSTRETSRKWNLLTLLLLIVFFPVGLFFMFRKTAWSHTAKALVTVGYVLVTGLAIYFASTAPPTLELANASTDKPIATDASSYKFSGSVYPYSSVITVNGAKTQVVRSNRGNFGYQMPLKQGDNKLTFTVTAGDKVTTKTYTVHRSTDSEKAARVAAKAKVDAAAKKKLAIEAAAKARADATAKTKQKQLAAAAAAKQKAQAAATAKHQAAQQKAAAAKAPTKPQPIISKLWAALDQSLMTRKGMDVKWNNQTKIAELSYSNKDFWNEKDVVGTSYRQFVQWGKQVAAIPGVETIQTSVKTQFLDSYGHEAMEPAVTIDMQVSDFKKFEWDNLKGQPIHNQLRSTELGYMYIHPGISKKVNLNDVKLIY